MKKFSFYFLAGLFIFISFFNAAEAASSGDKLLLAGAENDSQISVNIIAKDYAVIGEGVVFTAEIENAPLEDQYLQLLWKFTDYQYGSGMEMSHVFSDIGEYEIVLEVKDRENNLLVKESHTVKIGKEIILIISDLKYERDTVNDISASLKKQGDLVFNINFENNEEVFFDNLLKYYPIFDANSIILLSNDISFYNSLLNVFSKSELIDLVKGKVFFVVSSNELLSSALENIKNLIESPYLILTSDASLLSNVYKNGTANLLNNLYQSEADYQVFGVNNEEIPWYRFMLKGINQMAKHGVSSQNIWLILSLCLIATIVVISRQMIGLHTIGFYIPTLLAVSFSMTGLVKGLLYFAIIFIFIFLVRLITKRLAMFFIPKLGLLIIVVSLGVFATMSALAYIGLGDFLNVPVMPLLVMIMLSERFLSIHFEFGSKQAWYITMETILLSVFAYLIVSWQALRLFILAYPEFILLTVVLVLFFGKWTGLRLLEYSRFSKVIQKEMREDYSDLIIKK